MATKAKSLSDMQNLGQARNLIRIRRFEESRH